MKNSFVLKLECLLLLQVELPQVLSCVKHILETDKEVKVRQAALTVLKLLIKGLSLDAIQVSRKLTVCHQIANFQCEV